MFCLLFPSFPSGRRCRRSAPQTALRGFVNGGMRFVGKSNGSVHGIKGRRSWIRIVAALVVSLRTRACSSALAATSTTAIGVIAGIVHRSHRPVRLRLWLKSPALRRSRIVTIRVRYYRPTDPPHRSRGIRSRDPGAAVPTAGGGGQSDGTSWVPGSLALFRVAPGPGEGRQAEADRAHSAADVEGGLAAVVASDTAGQGSW